MCGRFALGIPKKRLEELVSAPIPEEYQPSWNIAPTRSVLIVQNDQASLIPWGLATSSKVPNRSSGTKNRALSRSTLIINARSESAFERPLFSGAMRSARCLVPAEAFYEWQRLPSGTRLPSAFAARNTPLTFLGGLLLPTDFPLKSPDNLQTILRLIILTTTANSSISPMHDRMPVILSPEAHAAWLDAATPQNTIRQLCLPLPAETMNRWPVSTEVNSVATDSPHLLQPVSRKQEQPLSLF
ncbi:SOS response-associated peptidase [Desulfovibrio mangrovi]|uniref:SOS response-associated peptidase n=1 Tax=Desulfovibrio mangrovi TaxID=2976983 RepID=UPI0022479290|nr:SOS response-associated peptidase [Desulfovibrio mangrovi]UZP66923.1 SOS response-associated peptidase [Desulfovibrio mangrovi]